MTQERCGNCRFYHIAKQRTRGVLDDTLLHEDDYEAECRRLPPVRLDASYTGSMGGSDTMYDCFGGPIVNNLAWCGEWRPGATKQG